VGGQRQAPTGLPPVKTRYPLYSRLGWPQDWSRRLRRILLPPGFDPRTVQPVLTHFTGYAIPARSLEDAGGKALRKPIASLLGVSTA